MPAAAAVPSTAPVTPTSAPPSPPTEQEEENIDAPFIFKLRDANHINNLTLEELIRAPGAIFAQNSLVVRLARALRLFVDTAGVQLTTVKIVTFPCNRKFDTLRESLFLVFDLTRDLLESLAAVPLNPIVRDAAQLEAQTLVVATRWIVDFVKKDPRVLPHTSLATDDKAKIRFGGLNFKETIKTKFKDWKGRVLGRSGNGNTRVYSPDANHHERHKKLSECVDGWLSRFSTPEQILQAIAPPSPRESLESSSTKSLSPTKTTPLRQDDDERSETQRESTPVQGNGAQQSNSDASTPTRQVTANTDSVAHKTPSQQPSGSECSQTLRRDATLNAGAETRSAENDSAVHHSTVLEERALSSHSAAPRPRSRDEPPATAPSPTAEGHGSCGGLPLVTGVLADGSPAHERPSRDAPVGTPAAPGPGHSELTGSPAGL